MKDLFLLLSFFLIFSCGKKEENEVKNNDLIKKEKSEVFYPKDLIELELNDSLNWAVQFKELQKAFLENDKIKIKTFVMNPILSEYNGIWHLLEIDIKEEKFSKKNIKKSL